jgi:threonine/homoserine/homoserine lactone efflux protein
MDLDYLNKVLTFWVIFYITPGPVWVAVMEATRKLNFLDTTKFFLKTFLTVNVLVQFNQAIICVVFIKFVSVYFAKIDLFLYILGGLYILYLAYKTLKSQQSGKVFELSFINLTMIMLLSPKIWLLFPSGAVFASQISESLLTNSLIFAISMVVISSFFFFVYSSLGKFGNKILADKFSYLTSALLLLFAVFLFVEAIKIY